MYASLSTTCIIGIHNDAVCIRKTQRSVGQHIYGRQVRPDTWVDRWERADDLDLSLRALSSLKLDVINCWCLCYWLLTSRPPTMYYYLHYSYELAVNAWADCNRSERAVDTALYWTVQYRRQKEARFCRPPLIQPLYWPLSKPDGWPSKCHRLYMRPSVYVRPVIVLLVNTPQNLDGIGVVYVTVLAENLQYLWNEA